MRTMNRMRPTIWWLGITCCLGCTKAPERAAVFPVHGQVLYEGRPIASAMVVFHPLTGVVPADARPIGYTDESGHFRLATFQPNDGAPAGKYVVTIERRVRPKELADDANLAVPNLLPAKYATTAATPLKIEVTSGENQLEPMVLRK